MTEGLSSLMLSHPQLASFFTIFFQVTITMERLTLSHPQLSSSVAILFQVILLWQRPNPNYPHPSYFGLKLPFLKLYSSVASIT